MAGYNFKEKKLWTGRLASFTKSIDSNRKLLRVILLSKGSSIGEFSNVMGKGLLEVNKLADTNALPKDFKDRIQPPDKVKKATMSLLKDSLPDGAKNFWGDFTQNKGHVDEETAVSLIPFKFEETQLYNLRTLSLNQKTFVDTTLRACVEGAATDDNKIPFIRQSFQYIATDIEIVQRAVVQRVHELDDEGNYHPSMQASALQITDMLALLALKPFQRLLPQKSDITPITFFSQETHIRSLPYCDNVVLIGIRYDQVLQDLESDGTPPPFELLAIPHEIGHYVYQRAILTDFQKEINDALSEVFPSEELSVTAKKGEDLRFEDVSKLLPERYQKWAEEIFSDVCGCIVAGPLVALSLLSILATTAKEDNQNDTGEHPTGVLRPFILKEILDELNKINPAKYPYSIVAEEISENLGHKLTPEQEIELDEIKKIIRVFAKILLNMAGDFKIWSSPNLSNLETCAKELKDIKEWPEFEGLEPSKLGKTLPKEGETIPQDDNDIEILVDEWKKKGPVTIGPH